eukprot:s162_g34.t1
MEERAKVRHCPTLLPSMLLLISVSITTSRNVQLLNDVLIRAAEDQEAEIDAEIARLDALKEDDLEELRRKRLEQMKSAHSDKMKKLAVGHGEYTMIEEKDFFDVAKKSERIVVHFWRESTWRCEVMDKHLRQLCQKHWGTRFVKINAEKAPYLAERLHIWCLPSLVLCVDGKTEHTIVGFSEFKTGDEVTTDELEEHLAKWGVIKQWLLLPHPQAVRRAQSQLTDVLDTLEEEDRKVMVFSLQFLREREEKAAEEVAQRADARGSGEKRQNQAESHRPRAPPPPGQGPSVEELARRIDALRAEKDELGSELQALQDICQRERTIAKDSLRLSSSRVGDRQKLHQMDLEEIHLQMQVRMSDSERLWKIAKEREGLAMLGGLLMLALALDPKHQTAVQELQLRLVKRKEQRFAQPRMVGARSEIISDGGFSDLSEIADDKNDRALQELPRQGEGTWQIPPENSLCTLVIAEFMHCDVGTSETAVGLKPRYDSLLSFGPFEVGDAEVEHFARAAVRLELQAFSTVGSASYVLGRAALPLAALLDCTPQDRSRDACEDPNPVIAGTLSFAYEADTHVQIATVRYKARWRKSIIKPLETYTITRGMSPVAAVAAVAENAGAQSGCKMLQAIASTPALEADSWIRLEE